METRSHRESVAMEPSSIAVLSGLLSAILLLLLPIRLWQLRTEKAKVRSGKNGCVKLVIASALSIAQLVSLVEQVAHQSLSKGVLLSSIVTLVACTCLIPWLYIEQIRSLRPADTIVTFLIASSACDVATLQFHLSGSAWVGIAVLSAGMLTLKLLLVVIESRNKRMILQDAHSRLPPEQLAGVLSRTFFWWINPLLASGNRKILKNEDLPPIDYKLSSRRLRRQILRYWDRRNRPETTWTLPKVLAQSAPLDFLSPVIPRLALIFFRYAQPALISLAIRALSHQTPVSGNTVIVAAIVVYLGLTIAKAVYQHRLNRLKIMINGAVVGLISHTSLCQRSNIHNDGRAVTLISTDAQNIGDSASRFHEFWAQIVEVIVGMTMLGREVGWVAPVPLVIIFLCSRMSRYLALNLRSRQKAWTDATQKRIAVTTSMLSSVKGMKMMGFTEETESLIDQLRIEELKMAKRVRWMMVAYNASANALGIFAPILTFVLFVVVARVQGSTLDTETAFTTVALLGLITHPANMIMTIVPQFVGSLAAFERIQSYLVEEPRTDQRAATNLPHGEMSDNAPAAVRLEDVSIQPTSTAPPILTGINLTVPKGSIVVCTGPVGSGKSMLTRVLLGEVSPSVGTVSVCSKRIAYCDQTPWLPNGTIKEVICGCNVQDEVWYREVLKLCCLDQDMLTLAHGDDTVIGNRGLNISGGQRQRVALARALYARCDLVVLDDSFSALDGKTETNITQNLLGSDGYFRKLGTTVFLAGNCAAQYRFADWIILLENGKVEFQGTPSELQGDAALSHSIERAEIPDHADAGKPEVNPAVASRNLKVTEALSDLSRSTGDFSLYGYYLKAVKLRKFLLLLACTATYSFFVIIPQYILQKWTEATSSQTGFYIAGYVLSSVLAWTATNGSMWTTHILIAPDSGLELHRRLLSIIVGAPLSFFSMTDTGSILNRFSQDMQLIDQSLPPAILSLSNQIFKLLVQVGLLFSAQRLLTATLPICFVVVYVVQRVYLRTSRQLRLLDLESQAAVFSGFLESIEGLVTIRAFGWERPMEQAHMQALDKSQQPAYVLMCLQRWLSIVLDLIVTAAAVGLIALAVLLKGTTTAGQIGMALNIVLVANTTLLGLVSSWANLEISLGAISRLKTLEAETPKEEDPSSVLEAPSSWPLKGRLELDNVTVTYNTPQTPALQDVTLSISPGQRLFVCGRTGSGKSTLMLTLLRMLDVQSGTVKLDGIDISTVPRSVIRRAAFITVAQDPFLLSQASLRFNLNPSMSLPDEAVVTVLQQTGLWSHFSLNGGIDSAPQILDRSVASLPQMSAGHMQLLALARAILQLRCLALNTTVKPILLLDEATSSTDPKTESTMHELIDETFGKNGHTVIVITHRLHGLADGTSTAEEMAVVLSQGKIERFGKAQEVF
ncbi:hypothetical protein NLU13_0196 [Sarocladium strictum]|uniref:ABC transporter n=1 Tax=Sarocladium strictum TaxID=5046 RepID=A0AA39LB21_SARSR|nr:hypothetical protein NLU13_0196 [Sarocladium strictum]